MNPAKKLFPALLALAVYGASAAAVSAITITSNSAAVYLSSSAGSGNAFFSGTSIPTSQLLDVTRGAYYARNQIDYTGSGDTVTLLNAFSQKRSGGSDDYSQGYDGSLYFTAGANSTYALSGAYSVSDVTSSGLVYFHSYLRDVTANTQLAYSYQYSINTLNESFVLGVSGGDTANNHFGSLTGSLIAGHQYEWYLNVLTQAYPDADGGATASGFVRLAIGGGAPSSVPDGGTTLTLLGLSVVSLAAYRRQVARV